MPNLFFFYSVVRFEFIGNDESTYQSFINDEVEGPGDGTNERQHNHQRSNSYQALDRLNTKIACTKESIRKEQTARYGNRIGIK